MGTHSFRECEASVYVIALSLLRAEFQSVFLFFCQNLSMLGVTAAPGDCGMCLRFAFESWEEGWGGTYSTAVGLALPLASAARSFILKPHDLLAYTSVIRTCISFVHDVYREETTGKRMMEGRERLS